MLKVVRGLMFDVRSYALIEDTTNSVSGVKFL